MRFLSTTPTAKSTSTERIHPPIATCPEQITTSNLAPCTFPLFYWVLQMTTNEHDGHVSLDRPSDCERKGKANFLIKLHRWVFHRHLEPASQSNCRALGKASNSDVCQWSPDGQSFIIWDHQTFARTAMQDICRSESVNGPFSS